MASYTEFHKVQQLYRNKQGNECNGKYNLFFNGWNFPLTICTCIYDHNYKVFMEYKKKLDNEDKKDYIEIKNYSVKLAFKMVNFMKANQNKIKNIMGVKDMLKDDIIMDMLNKFFKPLMEDICDIDEIDKLKDKYNKHWAVLGAKHEWYHCIGTIMANEWYPQNNDYGYHAIFENAIIN
jgi:DNA-binding protein Fis